MSTRYCLKTLSSLLLAVSATTAYGYNAEIAIGAAATTLNSETEIENNDSFFGPNTIETETDSKTRHIGTSVEVFFREVSTGTGPWQEAAFLSKTGSVFLGLARLKSEEETEDNNNLFLLTGDTEQTGDLIASGARIIVGPVILEPAYLSIKDEYETNWDGERKTRDVQLGIGGYIGNFQEVVVTLGKADIEDNFALEEEQPHIGLRYKAVFPVGASARVHIAPYASYEFANLKVDGEDLGDTRTSIIGITIYPRPNLGIGPEIRSEASNIEHSSGGFGTYYAYEDNSSLATIAFRLSYMPVEALLLNFRLSAIGAYDEYSQIDIDGVDRQKIVAETVGAGLGLDVGLAFRF